VTLDREVVEANGECGRGWKDGENNDVIRCLARNVKEMGSVMFEPVNGDDRV
jgi:hypothetical protein